MFLFIYIEKIKHAITSLNHVGVAPGDWVTGNGSAIKKSLDHEI